MWLLSLLWPLVGCPLCLAARAEASSTQCSWQDLQRKEFLDVSQKIQIRAEQGKGELTVRFSEAADTGLVKTIEHPDSYTLSMACSEDNSCNYKLYKSGQIVNNKTALVLGGPEKFIVEGQNLEWSQNCAEPEKETGDDTGSDKVNHPIWVLALVASGVAVTVVAVGILTWSICTTCRKNGSG